MFKKNLILILFTMCALSLSACVSTGGKALPLKAIPGVNAGGIWLHVSEDESEIILRGSVRRGVDRVLVEKHVRREFGYTNISNRITIRN